MRYKIIHMPLHGVDYSVPKTLVQPGFASNISNIRIHRGSAIGRLGLQAKGSASGSAIMSVGELITNTGVKTPFRIHLTGLQKWDGTSWVSITGTLTGANTDKFDCIQYENTVIFTNKVDEVKQWSGGASISNLTSSLTLKAKRIAGYGDRVVVGNTIEGSTTYLTRVRWSTTAVGGTDFAGTGSGAVDLDDISDPVMGLEPLLSELIIYKERSIYSAQRTGYVNNPFSFSLRVNNVGLYYPYTLIAIGNMHFFVSQDDIYLFDGVSTIPISGKIKDIFFDNIEGKLPNETFASYNMLTKEIFIFVTERGYTQSNILWVYNMTTNDWTTQVLGGTALSSGVVEDTSDVLWDVAMWDTDLWDSIRGEYRTYVGFLDGKVGQFIQVNGDFDVAFTSQWSSGEFNFGEYDKFYNLDKVIVEIQPMADFTMTVSVSVDGGTTFTNYTKNVTSSANMQRIQVYTNVVGKTFIFKVSCPTNYFILNGVLIEGRDAGLVI